MPQEALSSDTKRVGATIDLGREDEGDEEPLKAGWATRQGDERRDGEEEKKG